MSPGANSSEAYQGMEVEALRALTAALNAVTTNMAEDRRLLNDIHTRVIRIESNRLNSQVARLEARMDAFEKEVATVKVAQARADTSQSTAIGIAGWIARFAPWIGGGVVVAALGGLFGKGP